MRLTIIFSLFLIFSMAIPASAQQATRKIVDKAEPVYPLLAKKSGIAGAVKFRVTVTPDGKPKSVEVVGGSPVFIDSATEAVKKWRWITADHESNEVVEIRFSATNQGF